MPLCAELLFRGLLHGLIIPGTRIQTRGSDWFISWPVFYSAVIYAFFFGIPYSPFVSISQIISAEWYIPIRMLGGFIFGILTGIIRERSESIITSYLAHLISAVGVLFIYNAFVG